MSEGIQIYETECQTLQRLLRDAGFHHKCDGQAVPSLQQWIVLVGYTLAVMAVCRIGLTWYMKSKKLSRLEADEVERNRCRLKRQQFVARFTKTHIPPAGVTTKAKVTRNDAVKQNAKPKKVVRLPEPERFLPRVTSSSLPKDEAFVDSFCRPVAKDSDSVIVVNKSQNDPSSNGVHGAVRLMRFRVLCHALSASRIDASGNIIESSNDALVHQDGLTRHFHIPYLPNADHSAFLLKRLAREFKPIIQKRKYNVLMVAELCCCSDGGRAARGEQRNTKRIKVQTTSGSEDQCGGYNRTHRIHPGTVHSIFLRLRDRTNHYKFYPYHQVVKTMCHELAHCVHQNHSPAFWKLMKELQQEHKHLISSGAVKQNMNTEEQFGFDIYGAYNSSTRF